jgi:hypothetical protein
MTVLDIAEQPKPRKRPAHVDLSKQPRRVHRAVQAQLLTRDQLDPQAAQAFYKVVAEVTAYLGGAEAILPFERHLIDTYACITTSVAAMKELAKKGQAINTPVLLSAGSMQVRILRQLGVRRRVSSNDAVPDPLDYAREDDAS